MVGLPEIEYLRDEAPPNHDVDGLQVQMHDVVAVQLPQAVHHVQQEGQLGRQRNGLPAGLHVVIQLLATELLHEDAVVELRCRGHPEVLGQEEACTVLEFRYNLLLLGDLVALGLVAWLEPLHCKNPLHCLLVAGRNLRVR